MGIYILKDGDRVLSLAGQEADERMLEEGYEWAEGEIPQFDPYTQYLEYVDGAFNIKDSEITQEEINEKASKFLRDTDWKVLRHLRELTLGTTTTLTEEEFIALELERQNMAKSILKEE
jgi:hypothetical protein